MKNLHSCIHYKYSFLLAGRLMAKLLHPGNSWKLLKREAMRLFLLWYSALGEQAGDQVHAIFATLVPGFPSPYPNMGLTALAALTPEPGTFCLFVQQVVSKFVKMFTHHS